MLTLHHLNHSRSQRILWLFEELGLDYELITYQRDAHTGLAPPELKSIHPLGKAPVLEDQGRVITESGAIIDYVVRRHGKGRLAPPPDSAEFDTYVEWLHYAEGSAMLPFMLGVYLGRLGDAAAPLQPRLSSEVHNHLGYISGALGDHEYLVGDTFTAADIQVSFVLESAQLNHALARYPNLGAYLQRMRTRPAHQRALVRGGPFDLSAMRKR
ncbi:glutathione S-transferase family protein [Melittangium boletus]|uniref:glutathione transferase n=1 Tax=Melittangium boletus DSM 14713 TaxID=1294270 RepID=A0A250IA33_9BACT|nr:glutathione S-transferase [Melittangium boletus]ATB28734.1 glutathione S-transferase [Melittangium boletus DSM 14713]